MNDGDCDGAKAGFATRAIHYGYDPAEHDGALTPPVYMTSAYAFESVEGGRCALSRRARRLCLWAHPKSNPGALRAPLRRSRGGGSGSRYGFRHGGHQLDPRASWGRRPRVDPDHTLYGNSFALFMRGMPRFGVQVAAGGLHRS